MGQGESLPKSSADVDDYLRDAAVSRHQLLQQYSSVNVDSASEYSEPARTTVRDIPGIAERNPANSGKGRTNKKGAKTQNETGTSVGQSEDDFEGKLKYRKDSKDFSDASFPSTSTDRILEDYADYANELINAPYRLQNRYTSTETVNSSSTLGACRNKDKILLPTKRASANVYLKDPVKPGRVAEFISEPEKIPSNEILQHRPVDKVSQCKDEQFTENDDQLYLEPTEATYLNIPDFEIPKIVVSDETEFETIPFSQTDSERSESDDRNSGNVICGVSSNFPHTRQIPFQENTDFFRPDTNETYHQPLKRQGAVLVEVVENGDLTSEASTIIGPVSTKNSGTAFDDLNEHKLTQLCAIQDELRNLAKANANKEKGGIVTLSGARDNIHLRAELSLDYGNNDISQLKPQRCFCGDSAVCNCGGFQLKPSSIQSIKKQQQRRKGSSTEELNFAHRVHHDNSALRSGPRAIPRQKDIQSDAVQREIVSSGSVPTKVLTTDAFVSKIAVGNEPHSNPESAPSQPSRHADSEIYDDVLTVRGATPQQALLSDDSVVDGSVKSLAQKFERIALNSSRDNSPSPFRRDKLQGSRDRQSLRYRQRLSERENLRDRRHSWNRQSLRDRLLPKDKSSIKNISKVKPRSKSEDFAQYEEESIYEEFNFDSNQQITQSSSPPKPLPRKTKNKGVQVNVLFRSEEDKSNQYFEPLVIDTNTMVFNRKSKKQDKKRSRHRSDSSTSVVSEASATFPKAASKKKSTKDKRGHIQEDGTVVQQWGSTVTEYEENFGHKTNSSSKKKRSKETSDHSTQHPKEGYDNVRQVFNRGMVLPLKRAPPGMTAQEVESESEFTDLSGPSWRALSPGRARHGARVHNGGLHDDMYERTHMKQRMNESNYAHRAGLLNRDDAMRLSSQSSQYTSEIPVFHSPRHQRGTATRADVHRSAATAGHTNEYRANTGYNHVYGDYRSSGDYGSLPNYRRAHATENNRFPAHAEGRLSPRYSSSHTERPSSPESFRYNRKDTKVHSGYASTPEVQRRLRLVATNAPHLYRRARSTERNLSTERSFSPRRSRAISVPREVRTFHGQGQGQMSHPEQHRLQEKSYSHDQLDSAHVDYGTTGSQHASKKKMVRIEDKKKKRKKSLDERAKGVVDDIIDEAIELLSPKHQKKKKSASAAKVESSRKSRSRQKNVTHTTNVFNEIYEVDSDPYRSENVSNAKRAIRDYRSDQENARFHNERHDIQQFEDDLRSFREMQRKPLLRPAPIDNFRSELRSSIRPVPGSGMTRDGSLPPPRSAYRNYDYELSVGQHAHQSEEKQATAGKVDIRERSNMYSSDSEYSASHRAHYRRDRKPSKYPNLSFKPTRVRSEENLLSEQRKSDYSASLPKRPIQIKKPENPKFTGSYGYESEPDNPKRFNPPTLTRGLVTKILHKLDEDVKRASKRNMKRPELKPASGQEYSTHTWSHKETDPSYGMNPEWTMLSSPSSYSPKTEASMYSPTTQHDFSPMQNHTLTSHNQNRFDLHPGKIDLQLENPTTKADAHAQFKMHHGRSQPNINITIPQEGGVDAAKLNYVGRGFESADEGRYGAFSNEQMIVADLVDERTRGKHSKSTKSSVSQVDGKFYGTQPDVSMNKQQTLNFFLFNQKDKKEEEPVNVEISDEDEQSIDFNEATGWKSETETELREYYIHHKGTQTLSESESPKPVRRRKKESKSKYIIVQQPMQQAAPLPPPRQIETTHYITQQREIEKVAPEKQMREISIQTEKRRKPKPQKMESAVEVQSFISKPVITTSRHVQLPRQPTPEPTPPPSPIEIPVVYEHDFRDMQIEKHEPSEDEETVILETTEIEEKEQRIQMAIFEEYEFSHKRTEDGKTITVGGTDDRTEIPAFWDPKKYEVVVDKKKKKSTQVKETTQEDDHKKASGFTDGQLAIEQNNQYESQASMAHQHRGPAPMLTTTESATIEDTFTKEAQEKLAALEKVLESELSRKTEGGSAKNVQKENYEKPDDQGRLQEGSYTSYEKVVPLAEEEGSNQMFKSEKSLFVNSNVQHEDKPVKSSSVPKWTWIDSSHKKRDKSPARTGSESTESVRSPAYNDAYLSLFSAKPYVANRMHGQTSVTSNQWKSNSDDSSTLYRNQVSRPSSYGDSNPYGQDNGLDLETGVSTFKSSFRSDMRSPPSVGNFVGESHSEQSGPVAKTHYEKDADGNLVKVTEWEHKLTKTVEHPSLERQTKQPGISSALNKLPEDGYINMNLHETVIPQSESECSTESGSESIRQSEMHRSVGGMSHISEVTGETEVGHKPVHYESVENTLKIGGDGGEGLNERRFMYDVRKSQLKPVKNKKSSMNGMLPGYIYGETMSTPL